MIKMAINYLAVLGAALLSMAIGMLWYGPLFGKQWLASMRWSRQKAGQMKRKGKRSMLFATLGALLMSYVLAHFVGYLGAKTALDGATTGFWIWFGFAVPIKASSVLWEGKSPKLYALDIAHMLLSLLAMGALLAVWV